jgi:hypothetical protein
MSSLKVNKLTSTAAAVLLLTQPVHAAFWDLSDPTNQFLSSPTSFIATDTVSVLTAYALFATEISGGVLGGTIGEGLLFQAPGGLGICNSGVVDGDGKCVGDNTQIDNANQFDFLVLELPDNQRPAHVTLTLVDGTDDWIVWGTDLGDPSILDIPDDFNTDYDLLASGSGPGGTISVTINTLNTYKYLYFTGLLTADGDDDFKVKTVTVEPIPEPTSMVLLGLGMIGLGLAGARRRR